MDQDDDKIYILKKYGRRDDYIEKNGTIRDKYGATKEKLRMMINL